jgi:hypothetical protein
MCYNIDFTTFVLETYDLRTGRQSVQWKSEAKTPQRLSSHIRINDIRYAEIITSVRCQDDGHSSQFKLKYTLHMVPLTHKRQVLTISTLSTVALVQWTDQNWSVLTAGESVKPPQPTQR